MSGAADALQAARDRTGRLDEHDEVDGAHVDAELEAGGGDDRLEPTVFQLGLHLHALFARERAVVRAHELLAREVVEMRGQPFGGAPRVAEDDRGAVRADQFEDAWVHVGPDARVRFRHVEPERVRRCVSGRTVRAGFGHVVDGDDDFDVERLARAGVDDRDGARAVGGLAAEEARDLVERSLRRRQSNALW